MSFFVNLLYKKSSKISDYPEFQFSFYKIQNTLRKSILDFSLIKDLIILLLQRTKEHKYESEQKLFFDIIRKYLKYLFVDVYNKLKIEKKLNSYYQLVTTINFLLTLIANFPNKIFLETIFESNCNLLKTIIKCLKLSQQYKEQFEISKILLSFFTIEYVDIFNDLGLKDLFNTIKDQFVKIIINFSDYSRYSSAEYKILMKHILVLEFDYKKVFESEDLCQPEDKPLLKSLLCQALVRIIFSREKNEYLCEVNSEVEQNQFVSNSINSNSITRKPLPDSLFKDNIINSNLINGEIILEEDEYKPSNKKSFDDFEKRRNESILSKKSKLSKLSNHSICIGEMNKNKDENIKDMKDIRNNEDNSITNISFEEGRVRMSSNYTTNSNNNNITNNNFVMNLAEKINSRLKSSINKDGEANNGFSNTLNSNNSNNTKKTNNTSKNDKIELILEQLMPQNYIKSNKEKENTENQVPSTQTSKTEIKEEEKEDKEIDQETDYLNFQKRRATIEENFRRATLKRTNPGMTNTDNLINSSNIPSKHTFSDKNVNDFDKANGILKTLKTQNSDIPSTKVLDLTNIPIKHANDTNDTEELGSKHLKNYSKINISQNSQKSVISETQKKQNTKQINLKHKNTAKLTKVTTNTNSNINTNMNIVDSNTSENNNSNAYIFSELTPATKELTKTKYSFKSHPSNNSFVIDDVYIDPDFIDNFELSFLRNVSKKCVHYYLEKFGNKHQVLFRREEAYDDIIKIMFNMYGSNFLNSIYIYLKNIKTTTSNIKVFVDFYEHLLEILFQEMPKILIIMIKLIYESVLESYKVDTYEPILTVLFFNFIFNPKNEDINGIKCTNASVNEVNKIVNKICFNNKFLITDQLSAYNDVIPELHNKTLLTIESLLTRVDVNDSALQLIICEEVFMEGIETPNWMFYFDCDYILRLFDTINILSYSNRTSSMSSRESFYVKIDTLKYDNEIIDEDSD